MIIGLFFTNNFVSATSIVTSENKFSVFTKLKKEDPKFIDKNEINNMNLIKKNKKNIE